MIYKKIKLWSIAKLKAWYIASVVLYFLVSIGGPLIIINNQYAIFQGTTSTISGWGLFMAVVFAIVLLKKIKVKIYEFKPMTIGEHKFNNTVKMIYEIIVPAIVCFVLLCFKENFDTAYNTVLYCMYPYIGGIIIDNMICNYLKAILDFKREKKHKDDVDEM